MTLPFAVKLDVSIMRGHRKFLGWRQISQESMYATLEAPEKDYLVDCTKVPEVLIKV